MKKCLYLFLFLVSNFGFSQVVDTFISLSTNFKNVRENRYTIINNNQSNTNTDQVGAPQLPIFSRNYVLPAGSKLTNIQVNNSSPILMGNNIYLYPSQPPCPLNGAPCPDFANPDPAVYNSNTPFPVQTATVSNDASPFGYHVVTVNFCPFQYLPKDQKLYLYNQINLTINYNIGLIEYQLRITEKRNQLTKEIVKASVQNPTAISANAKTANLVLDSPSATDKLIIPWKPSGIGNMPDYIIITNEALKESFKPFVDYKTQRGIPTVLVTVEDIYDNYAGCDKPEKIRNYLKEAFNYWGAGLFVLLGGDTPIVPGRIAAYNTYNGYLESNYTDLYYADVHNPGVLNYNWNSNGNDLFGETMGSTIDVCELGPDNFIGRAPVDSVEEANNFISKIIKYEKLEGVTEKNYVNNMLFLGAYIKYDLAYANNSVQNSEPPYLKFNDPYGQKWHRNLANESFLGNIDYKKWLLFDDYQGSPYSNHPLNPSQYYQGNEELSRGNVLGRLSNGVGFGKFHLVSHIDHGSPWSISTSGKKSFQAIYREDMDNLTNGNYYQIMYTTACDDGDFGKDCFAEHYVNAQNGGGVAILANSGTVLTGAYTQDKTLFQSIYGNLSSSSYILGVASTNARDYYGNNYAKRVLTLFGEPTMATWSATPQNIALSVPASITIDNAIANILPVTINALTEKATVTVYKFNTITNSIEVYASQDLVAGATTANFTLNPDTTGALTVMVTAKNYLPATASVNILLPQAHLYVSGIQFSDSNNNGSIEQGETINLIISLTNSGGTNISGINTVLSCSQPTVANITSAQANILQINAGQTVQLTGLSFVAQIANGTVVFPEFVEFLLNITAANNYVHLDNFYLNLKNPILNLGTRKVTDGLTGLPLTNYPINQHINIDIQVSNTGNVPTGALTAVLTCSNQMVEIENPASSYPNIALFDTQQNATPFTFHFTGEPTGSVIFTLALTSIYGKTWIFSFDLNEGLPPLITGFKFTSTQSDITLKWNPITPLTTIKGYNVYRSGAIDGNYSKQNDFLITGSSFYKDSNVNSAQLSAYFYKISVVSLTGNERALLNVVTTDTPPKQGYIAWTTLNNHTAFPRQGANVDSGISSPTVFDVDNNGTKEIFTNLRGASNSNGKIMGFYESGQEMYNIDGNETTVSGFATTNMFLWSNSAVGDLDNDGHAEVLSLGRINVPSQGKLYVYKTTDANGDNKPDKFWNDGDNDASFDFEWRTLRNPVLYDVDGNGFLDIIVVDEHQKVWVLDKDKNVMSGWPKQVFAGLDEIVDYAMGQIAVADLDHDGKAEIALGLKSTIVGDYKGAIFIWRFDGTPFTVNPFKEFPIGERADSGIVFADLDNDFNLDILINTKSSSSGKIYAFKQNGEPLNDAWNGQTSYTNSNSIVNHDMPTIAVGDLNHDGNLEVTFGSQNQLFVLDKIGSSVTGFPQPIADMKDKSPIIADINGNSDGNREIIINNDNGLFAYNFDGTPCIGFPILPSGIMPFAGTSTIADLDGNGKNEIVLAAGDAMTYAFDTNGDAEKIDWGSYRGNASNTGTYKEVCNNTLDLIIKDGSDDTGVEPNTATEFMWTSDNIWVRPTNDNSLVHTNPTYNGNGNINYVKVRVINKSCVTSLGGEQVTLYWAKASTSLSWPQPWDGTVTYPATNATMGGTIGTITLDEPMVPGQEVILSFPWLVPNPLDYNTNDDYWHFCLLAQINAETDPLAFPLIEGELYANVMNNNNLAWKNITVVTASNVTPSQPTGVVAVGNPNPHPKNFYLELQVEDLETGKPIFQEAEVGIKMDEILYNAWVRGGKNALKLDPTLEEKRKIVNGNHVLLKNIAFNENEIGTLHLYFNFLTEELTQKTNYVYHVIQKETETGKIVGGETFVINKNPRNPFFADAGDDKEVDSNQSVTVSAADINEPAIYNWYDEVGNLIFQGKDLQISNAVTQKYKLEVISTIDGFKDYSDVDVIIKPNRLKAIAPNPAIDNLNVSYNLNQANSAYIMITSYYNTIGVSNNYIVNVNSSETNISLNNYPVGFYKVILVVNGEIVGAKILYKQ